MWHICETTEVWQFDKLQHCQEMALWVPEWLYGNWGWIAPRMTERGQRRFDKYCTSFNGRKWICNRCWNWVILPRCGLLSSVTWNSSRNKPSLPQHEKICTSWVLKLLDDGVKMEKSVCGLRLHVLLPCQRGRPVRLDSHQRWEMGSSFCTRDEECIEVVDSDRWWMSSEKEVRKISQ